MQVFSKDQERHRDRQHGASEAGIMAVCLRKGKTVELGPGRWRGDTYGDARKECGDSERTLKYLKNLCC